MKRPVEPVTWTCDRYVACTAGSLGNRVIDGPGLLWRRMGGMGPFPLAAHTTRRGDPSPAPNCSLPHLSVVLSCHFEGVRVHMHVCETTS